MPLQHFLFFVDDELEFPNTALGAVNRNIYCPLHEIFTNIASATSPAQSHVEVFHFREPRAK